MFFVNNGLVIACVCDAGKPGHRVSVCQCPVLMIISVTDALCPHVSGTPAANDTGFRCHRQAIEQEAMSCVFVALRQRSYAAGISYL